MECAVDIRDSSNHDPQEEETFLRLARTTSAAAKASASHENGRQTTAAMNFSWCAEPLRRIQYDHRHPLTMRCAMQGCKHPLAGCQNCRLHLLPEFCSPGQRSRLARGSG